MMRSLIIGLGEIGTAIHGIFPSAQTLDLTPKTVQGPIDVLHICFPYSEDFVSQVKDYQQIYKPNHTIIYSTVAIGTTYKCRAVHSPVEGRHPDLEFSIRRMTRWLGGGSEEERIFFKKLFKEQGIDSRLIEKSKYTEALKLLSTSEYGINLVFADYKAQIAKVIGMEYALTKEWNNDYNQLYKDLGEDYRFQKFVLDPPRGVIGGHCIIPNAKLLNEFYPDDILDLIEEYDEQS